MITTFDQRPHALYRFYGAGGTLLYIGITADLPTRLTNHRDDKAWWLGVTNVTVEHYPDRTSVLEAERRAIVAERPLYNQQHNTESPPDQLRRPRSRPLYRADSDGAEPCPACDQPSYYITGLDRYIHSNGAWNAPCWIAFNRSPLNGPIEKVQPSPQTWRQLSSPLTPICMTCEQEIPRGDKGVVHVVSRTAFARFDALEEDEERERLKRAEAPSGLYFTTASELHRRFDALPPPAIWGVHCDPCNPHPDDPDDPRSWCSGCYWFSVDRCRTWAQLIEWTCHLSEKNWLKATNWMDFIRAVAHGTAKVGLVANPRDTRGADA